MPLFKFRKNVSIKILEDDNAVKFDPNETIDAFIILDFIYHIEGYPHSLLHHAMERIPIKLVVVGDGAVGKTSLMFAFTTGEFNTEYIRHMYEGDPQDLTVNEILVQLTMYEGPTQMVWTRPRRKFLYPDADVILMCFSLVAEYRYINF